MGRNKGESYRKWKLKENPRKECPKWTIDVATLEMLKEHASKIGACQSRIVEAGIKLILTHPKINDKDREFSKIFHKN